MTNKPRLPLIVCVDDDAEVLGAIARCLRGESGEVRATVSAKEALDWISADEVAVLVTDYDMEEMTGAQLASHARRLRPETVRILLTGQRSLETAVDGINQGEIFRFLSKPFEHGQLRQAVQAGLQRNRELLALTGDRERRERREALHTALEAEYPGISEVVGRDGVPHEVPANPWAEAADLGLVGLTAKIASGT